MMTDGATQIPRGYKKFFNHKMRLYGESKLPNSSESSFREYEKEAVL